MALVVISGAPGSPGITTAALGVALTWQRDVLLADCDAEPKQSVRAGYLRGDGAIVGGLTALARAHRENRPLGAGLLDQTMALAGSETIVRRFLPGFALPAAVGLFDPVWPDLADAFCALEEQGMDVVVDAGHVGRYGLPTPLLARADAVCFCTRSDLRSLAAARLYLPILVGQLADLPADRALGLLLVGPNRPYSASEIQAQFGVRCWAELDWSPDHAGVLSDGAPEPRRFGAGRLLSQLRAAATVIRERIDAGHEAITPVPAGVRGV